MKEAELNVYGFQVTAKYRGKGDELEVVKISVVGGMPEAMSPGEILDECQEILRKREETGEIPKKEEADW